MSRINFKLRSSRGDCDLCCYKWLPDTEVKAVLFMAHGMEEHILRYDDFANYLNTKGIAVYGHDHLGHGNTSPNDLGFIAEKNGDDCLVNDMSEMEKFIEKEYPDVPRVIFGHSMGSFIIRRYITRYGETVDGAIAMGTGQNPQGLLNLGVFMCNTVCKIKGTHSKSKMLDNLVMGKNNDKYPGTHPHRWLSNNDEANDEYLNDPFCGFTFTSSAYRDLLMLLKRLGKEEDFDKIPKNLKMLMVSGSDDVIGDFGKGVDRCVRSLNKYGITPKVVYYEGMRHCPLIEKDWQRVADDIAEWVLSIQKRSD